MSSVSSTPRRVPVLRVLVMALLLANGCVQARDRLATAAFGLAALSACASPMHMAETSGPAASLSATG